MSVYLVDYENVHSGGLKGVELLSPKDELVLFYKSDASTIPMDLHVDIVNSGAKLWFIKIEKTAKNYLDFQLAAVSGYLVAMTEQTEFIIISDDTGFDSVVDLWSRQNFLEREVSFARRGQIKPRKRRTTKKAASSADGKKTAANGSEEKKAASQEEKKTGQTTDTKVTEIKADAPVKGEKRAETGDAADRKPSARGKKRYDRISEAHKKSIRLAVRGIGLKPSDYIKIYRIFMMTEDKHEYNIELVKAFQDQDRANQIYKATRKEFESK